MEKSRSVPTIPSRYTVTLIKGNREYKGFNSRSMRFEVQAPSEAPGPGSYGQQKAFHEDFTGRPSWGVRGTGGFASKARRFNVRILLPGLGCPGPGAYGAPSLQKAVRAPSAASFASSKTSRAQSLSELPGPGQYEPRFLANQSEGARAAFRSTSLRLENPSDEAAPGPGDYHDGLVRPVGYIPEHLQSLDMRMPTFKARSVPRITRVHRDLPAASAKARGLLGNFADEVSRQCLGSQALAVALPGPGEYQDIAKAHFPSAATSAGSAFQGSKRMDLGAQESSFPGPGKYEPRKVASPMARTLRSAFQSTSDRGKVQVSSAPGPAYYNPSMPKLQKSFRMKTANFVA